MKFTTQLLIATTFSLIALVSCSDYGKLESIKISPAVENAEDDTANDLYVCKSTAKGGIGFRQFNATGYYSDDSTKNLTNDSKWATDASDDSYLSSVIPGSVKCATAYGVIGVAATYTENNSGTESTDSEDTVDFTDSVQVNAK